MWRKEMVTHNWKLDNNKSVPDLLKEEPDLNVVIMYQDDIQRAGLMRQLRDSLGDVIVDRSNYWTMLLRNRSWVKFVRLQRSQIELRGISISLLLFPSSVEYNVRREITRELRPQLISNGAIVGTIRI